MEGANLRIYSIYSPIIPAGEKKIMEINKNNFSSNQPERILHTCTWGLITAILNCVWLCVASREQSFNVLLATLKKDFKS